MKPIPYGKQFVTDTDIENVVEVLHSDWLTQGPKVGEFEKQFAEAVHAPFATAVSSGTAGLHLAVDGLLTPGKKVVTTPITFAATANSIVYCGGIPVFVDIDPATLCICPTSVRQALEENGSEIEGIIAVSFAGYPAPLGELREICDEYGLWLIEDACHAPGAWRLGEGNVKNYSGDCTLADVSVFSFHPVKHIAMGEGGAITTRHRKQYVRHQRKRSHGITANARSDEPWRYDIRDLGYNYRITDIQCTLGMSQLARLHENIAARQRIAATYTEELSQFVQCPQVPDNINHSYHLYVIQTDRRRELYDSLHSRNIRVQVHYVPTYCLTYYRQNGYRDTSCFEAEKYYSRCLSLPIFPTLTQNQQQFVVESIQEFFEA